MLSPESQEKETQYTAQEVAKHSLKESLWVIIHGWVYDVTHYLEEHPGGDIVLLTNGGQDATEEFEDNGHSADARELMASYKIGVVLEEEGEADKHEAHEKGGCSWIKSAGLVSIGCALLVAALMYQSRGRP